MSNAGLRLAVMLYSRFTAPCRNGCVKEYEVFWKAHITEPVFEHSNPGRQKGKGRGRLPVTSREAVEHHGPGRFHARRYLPRSNLASDPRATDTECCDYDARERLILLRRKFHKQLEYVVNRKDPIQDVCI